MPEEDKAGKQMWQVISSDASLETPVNSDPGVVGKTIVSTRNRHREGVVLTQQSALV